MDWGGSDGGADGMVGGFYPTVSIRLPAILEEVFRSLGIASSKNMH